MLPKLELIIAFSTASNVHKDSNFSTFAGLDPGDRQALEMRYSGCDPPCLLDSSDGRCER